MRLARVAVTAVCLMLAAAGCARLPGIDGVLTDQWPAMAEPKLWSPVAGTCHSSFNPTLNRTGTAFGDCAKAHAAEIIHVGQFQGADGLDKPPAVGSPAHKAAWAECDAKASEHLGGAWRERKVWIGISVPTASSWTGGARWFGCEMGVITRMKGALVNVSYSLKGKFEGEAALLFGCLQVDKDGKFTEKACTEAHNSEFVGVVAWDTSWEDLNKEVDKEDDAVHRKCLTTVGTYVGASVRSGTYVWIPAENDWNSGDRTVRCFFWLGADKTVSKSMKGVGAGEWPLK
jgi:hypothetical protein